MIYLNRFIAFQKGGDYSWECNCFACALPTRRLVFGSAQSFCLKVRFSIVCSTTSRFKTDTVIPCHNLPWSSPVLSGASLSFLCEREIPHVESTDQNSEQVTVWFDYGEPPAEVVRVCSSLMAPEVRLGPAWFGSIPHSTVYVRKGYPAQEEYKCSHGSSFTFVQKGVLV